jgi:hypothetical protein
MLAGLIFATDDADDRPDKLAATLPFGGGTLLEYQARLLTAAGAAQVLVAVTRLTPELIGAVNRIGARVPVDIVRSAREAAEKVHPLARIIVVADGLVTTGTIVDMLANEGDDALLVTSEGDALPGFERVDAGTFWAGLARVESRRLDDVARFPSDYDFQSTLLRVLAQGRAVRIALPASAAREGHGIQRDSRALADRSRAVLSSIVTARPSWFDRIVLAPLVARGAEHCRRCGRCDCGDRGIGGARARSAGDGTRALHRRRRRHGACCGAGPAARRGPSRHRAGLGGRRRRCACGAAARSGCQHSGDDRDRLDTRARSRGGGRAARARGEAPPQPMVLLFAAGGHPLLGLAVACAYAAVSLAAAIERLTAEA